MTLLRSLADPGLLCCGLLAVLVAAPGRARAETFHTCTGFIDTLPATIATQGVWCLRKDLTTSLGSGAAISIQANNVTLDCNGFKVGGQSAGVATTTIGVDSPNASNTIVRNCTIRGFFYGASLAGTGGGHRVEDNRFDGNTFIGAFVGGDGSVVRGNQVLDTGASTVQTSYTAAIYTSGTIDAIDNTISFVLPGAGDNGAAYGILMGNNHGGAVAGNRVRGLIAEGTGEAIGVFSFFPLNQVISGNTLVGAGNASGAGVRCHYGPGYAKDNVVLGFPTAVESCVDLGNSP